MGQCIEQWWWLGRSLLYLVAAAWLAGCEQHPSAVMAVPLATGLALAFTRRVPLPLLVLMPAALYFPRYLSFQPWETAENSSHELPDKARGKAIQGALVEWLPYVIDRVVMHLTVWIHHTTADPLALRELQHEPRTWCQSLLLTVRSDRAFAALQRRYARPSALYVFPIIYTAVYHAFVIVNEDGASGLPVTALVLPDVGVPMLRLLLPLLGLNGVNLALSVTASFFVYWCMTYEPDAHGHRADALVAKPSDDDDGGAAGLDSVVATTSASVVASGGGGGGGGDDSMRSPLVASESSGGSVSLAPAPFVGVRGRPAAVSRIEVDLAAAERAEHAFEPEPPAPQGARTRRHCWLWLCLTLLWWVGTSVWLGMEPTPGFGDGIALDAPRIGTYHGSLHIGGIGVRASAPPISDDDAFANIVTLAAQGAELVMFAEYYFTEQTEEQLMLKASNWSRDANVWLVTTGYITSTSTNMLMVHNNKGVFQTRAQMVHPVGVAGNWKPNAATNGLGRATMSDGTKLCLIICGDASYPIFGELVGRESCDILLSPSNDWISLGVDNSRYKSLRAIENGANFVRVTSNGFSLAIDVNGRTLFTHDANADRVPWDSPVPPTPPIPNTVRIQVPRRGRFALYPWLYDVPFYTIDGVAALIVLFLIASPFVPESLRRACGGR